MIRLMEKEDLTDVLEIYRLGIETEIVTFEKDVPSINEWHQKYHPLLRYVFIENKIILGWISVTPISSRKAYKGVGEVSVYVHPSAKRKGIGFQLLQYLIEQAKYDGYWMLQSSIFEVNVASIQLHEKLGFRTVGIKKAIAYRNEQWINTVLMEKHLILNG